MNTAKNNINEVKKQMENWWNLGEQDKPLLYIQCLKDEHEPIPETDDLEKHWMDVDFKIDRAMKVIDSTNYYGVALPNHYVDFSATAMACSLGGKVHFVDKETIWSHPVFENLDDLKSAKTSMDHIAYRSIMETTRRSVEYAKGHHYVSQWAFGGILDNISGLYDTQELMVDLLIEPETVAEVMDHFTDIWIDEFNKDIELINSAGNEGHVCCWIGIWAPGSTFPIQEDLSYMISPDTFRELCIPRIKRIVNAMDYPLYHLDGDGALVHLDELLKIENLKAIQWQPGAGKERLDLWYDVIKKIIAGGKACQVFAEPDEIDALVENVGTKGLLAVVKNATNKQAEELMKKWG